MHHETIPGIHCVQYAKLRGCGLCDSQHYGYERHDISLARQNYTMRIPVLFVSPQAFAMRALPELELHVPRTCTQFYAKSLGVLIVKFVIVPQEITHAIH